MKVLFVAEEDTPPVQESAPAWLAARIRDCLRSLSDEFVVDEPERNEPDPSFISRTLAENRRMYDHDDDDVDEPEDDEDDDDDEPEDEVDRMTGDSVVDSSHNREARSAGGRPVWVTTIRSSRQLH